MNLDPVGPVAKADANNRLVLYTDRATMANAIFGAVASSIMAVLAIGFFYMRFVRGLPPRWDDKGLIFIALIGTLFIPLAIYWVLRVLYPAQLEINDEGLVYQARGRTKKMPWAALQQISFRQIYLSKTLNTKTETRITGNGHIITFLPDFGVSPSDLAQYIAARQKSSGNPPAFNGNCW